VYNYFKPLFIYAVEPKIQRSATEFTLIWMSTILQPPVSPPWPPASLAQLNCGPCPTNPSLFACQIIKHRDNYSSAFHQQQSLLHLVRPLRSWFEPKRSLIVGIPSIDMTTALACDPAYRHRSRFLPGDRSLHATCAVRVPTTCVDDQVW